MTLSTQTSKTSYLGNGVTRVFPLPFPFLRDADIKALLVVEGMETPLLQGTHYALAGAGVSSGGQLTMVSAPATGSVLVIWRAPAIVQEVDYVENSAFPAETHESALDLLTMICQTLQEQLDRAVLYPVSTLPEDILGSREFLAATAEYRTAAAASEAEAAASRIGAVASAAAAAESAARALEVAATADGLVKVSGTDALAQSLSAKLTAGNGLAESLADQGGAESLALSVALAENSGLEFAGGLLRVDAAARFRRNLVCNGDFRVNTITGDTEGTPTATLYFADNAKLVIGAASKLKAQRITTSATGPYALRLTTASACTPASAQAFLLRHGMEGGDTARLLWGTAAARPVTVQAKVLVSIPGTYAFSLHNGNDTRSYVFTKDLAAGVNRITETVPGDAAGAWGVGRALSLALFSNLGSGADFATASPRTWLTGNYHTTAGCVQLVANAGATLDITDIQVEPGDFATEYDRIPMGDLERWCRRYHPYLGGDAGVGSRIPLVSASTTLAVGVFQLGVDARAPVTGMVTPPLANMTLADYGGAVYTPLTVTFGGDVCRSSARVAVTHSTGTAQSGGLGCFLSVGTGQALRFTGAEL